MASQSSEFSRESDPAGAALRFASCIFLVTVSAFGGERIASLTVDPISISSATDADRAWAARLMADSDPWVRLGLGFEQCLDSCRKQPGTTLFIAWTSEMPLGFALLRERGVAGSPYLVSIGVAGAARGSGVGKRLLDHIEERSRLMGKHMFLCVSSFNDGARRWYERCGYVQVGDLPDYIVEGASEILMHKRLDRS